MEFSEKLTYLSSLIEELEKAANIVTNELGKPLYINEKGKQRFRYSNETSLLFQTLNAIRSVSLLNACFALLKVGHIHEMGIVLRAVYEDVGEIEFVQEAHENRSPTEGQQEIINLFFQRDLKTTEELMAEEVKVRKVPKKKIRAAMVGLGRPFENPEKIKKFHEVMDDTFSAYTHGELPTIMELYEGGTEKFRLNGMADTYKMDVFLWQLSSAIMNSLNSFTVVARNMSLKELAVELQTTRKNLECSEVYKNI